MEKETDNRRDKLIALVMTIAFHAIVFLLLLSLYLRYSGFEDPDRTWPPVDSSELLFGGEYVMVGDRPELAQNSQSPAPSSNDATEIPSSEVEALDNSGVLAEPAPVMTSEQPSPHKVNPQPVPEQTGPSKAEIEAAERAKREQEQRQAIANRVSNANFAGTGGTGQGNAGSPDGNADMGAVSGTPGHNLKGRSIAHYELPPKGPLGTITVRVSVNRDGEVTSASYLSGDGQAAASVKARNNCVAAARASRFSVDRNAPVSQTGTITYKFR